ncbi:Aminoglycoside phosphotransferase [Penicillium cf. griseofulvum]|uniref:Aminoglycoside phosphotransferase n=1 Tax=Penicillium cf. griseofulvum TaxID=2972120 RepID=A0A9W9T279_9EURO|nr:Aminoglycoside phosphotransferase [Penicillium cf. griseofulvum]KAJ5440259.1 Aminoglycoside phosphotransferase [Penicillium cf. griseofulvum]KAJ5448308.1 Aminoglycoside phosphotransferase [Penicillium cf. griseofulvum]
MNSKKIDPLFFDAAQSPETAWKERLGLLSKKEIEEMEKLVALKLEEMKTRVLRWDPDEYTVEAMAKVDGADGAH